MGNFFSKFGFTLNIGAAVLLFLAYLAPIIPPDSFWPLSFFGLAYPYLALVNFIFLIIWAIQRSKRLLLPLLSLLMGYYNISNTIQFLPKSSVKSHGIKVLSYNVHSFRYDLRTKRTNDPKILKYFLAQGADIICLQEITILKSGKLSPQGIRDALPEINYYQLASSSTYSGSITFSRYPIVNLGEIRFPKSSNLVLFSDIKISNEQTIRVYNCHLQSYSLDPDDYTVDETHPDDVDNQQIEKARKISYKLKSGFTQRAFQARKVAEHISKSPYPVLVCGDFNDTPVSYAYRKVRGELKDAFVETGWGISNTYNGELPSFRIDYIFYNNQFSAVNYEREKVYFSDHFPIHCQVELKSN